jgi:hypothetical protein
MWRLTEDAALNGVKSTTRYRSKQPSKRSNRNQRPQPQRQASGMKGGQAARRSARLRRAYYLNDVHNTEPYASRSVPRVSESMLDVPLPSPCVLSPSHPLEDQFVYSDTDSFGKSPALSRLGIYPAMQGYMSSPTSHSQGALGTEQRFMLHPSPSTSFFTDSPSPTIDEPSTPDFKCDWAQDMPLCGPYVHGDLACPEFEG